MTTFPQSVHEPFYNIELLEMDSHAAGSDVLTDPVRSSGYSDEWVLTCSIDSIAGTLRIILQESNDYNPNIHATPADAHWYDTVEIGSGTSPIVTVGQGAYSEYHFAPLARYTRIKYSLTGNAEFSANLYSKSGKVSLDG